MEQWEIDLRQKLDKEVEHGCYQIGNDKWVYATGKLGYINYLVEAERLKRGIESRLGLEHQIDSCFAINSINSIVDFEDIISQIYNNGK